MSQCWQIHLERASTPQVELYHAQSAVVGTQSPTWTIPISGQGQQFDVCFPSYYHVPIGWAASLVNTRSPFIQLGWTDTHSHTHTSTHACSCTHMWYFICFQKITNLLLALKLFVRLCWLPWAIYGVEQLMVVSDVSTTYYGNRHTYVMLDYNCIIWLAFITPHKVTSFVLFSVNLNSVHRSPQHVMYNSYKQYCSIPSMQVSLCKSCEKIISST